jgi:Flp pilus assembly protein TadG
MVLIRRRPHRERGAVLVMVAPLLVVIFAVTALTIDMGNARQESRQAQGVADAASLAGGRELPVMAPVSDTAFAKARQRAVEFAGKNVTGSPTAFSSRTCPSGSTAATRCFAAGGTTLTVTTPYDPGVLGAPKPYNLIQVKICTPTSTFFSQVIGASSPTVCRDAVGRRQNITGGFGMGLVVINPTVCNALVFAGDSGTVLSSNGAVMVNSECPNNALSATGQAWELTTEYIGVVGGASLSPCSPPYTCTEAIPESGVEHFPDPYAGVKVPAASEFDTSPTNLCSNSGNMVLEPGRYPQGCQKSSGDFIVRPGEYYFDQGFKATGGNIVCHSTLTSLPADYVPPPEDDPWRDCPDGVTFIIGGGDFELGGNGSVHLPPSTGGDYAGISIYQLNAGSAAGSKVNGSSSFYLGSIYAPNAYYEFTGSSGSNEVNIYGMVVTGTAKVSGKFQFNIDVPLDAPEALPADDFGLWE